MELSGSLAVTITNVLLLQGPTVKKSYDESYQAGHRDLADCAHSPF